MNDLCPCKREDRWTDGHTHAHVADGHVKVEAKTGVTQLQAKECH